MTQTTQQPPPLAPLSQLPPARSALNWRSVLLGFVGAMIICTVTPWNDYALNNTFMVGNNLPLGLVLLAFLFVVFVNGPLNRWAPKWAFSSGELTVALAMTLVSCTLPSSGLMRYFPGSLVSPWWAERTDSEWSILADKLHLPHWIYPRYSGAHPSEWANDPVVTAYINRWNEGGSPPYAAWIRPALVWGVFIFAMYGAMLCIIAIVRRQWYENERIPFPLAQIYLALVEKPPPKKWFNEILGRRSFWIAFFSIFVIHLWNGMAAYSTRHFPRIPVFYNLWDLFAEPPWRYMNGGVKSAAVFFTVVGVTYFLSSQVAFSLWFFFIARNVYQMYLGTRYGDATIYARDEWHLGGILAYMAAVFWVGRQHWKLVIAQAFRGARRDEPKARYLPYAVSFWCLITCVSIMIGWLWLAGCTLLGAACLVILLLFLFTTITRLVAEAGLVHGQLQVPLTDPFAMCSAAGWGKPVPVETFFLGSTLNAMFYDYREVMSVYASHALKVADTTMFSGQDLRNDARHERRMGRRLLAVLALTLVLGFFASLSSTLWMKYKYALTQDVTAARVNEWGNVGLGPSLITRSTVLYNKGNYTLPEGSQSGNLAFGAGFVAALAFLRLRFAWWPFHPVGFLLMFTFPGEHLWFSIMIGWICKVLIVRFGGPRKYTNAKPFFMGLIAGESVASGFWLIVAIILSSLKMDYRAIHIMPG